MTTLPITGNVDPALLAGMAALRQSYDGLGEATERAGQRAESNSDGWRRAADTFNEVHLAATTVLSTVSRLADRITELATEQGRLDDMSRQLGLNFDDAAESAGRFADETEAMGVAGRFAAADIRLTQEELNAVMRVAGSTSTMLGTTTAGAVQMLQEALIRGREGGLQRFGAGLAEVAGEGHTVNERLAALVVQASHTAAATDTAADSVDRFRDSLEDSQRVAASAFSTELARLGAVAQNARTASEGVEGLNRNLAAAGQTMALAVAAISGGMGIIVGSVGTALGALGQVASYAVPIGGLGGGLNDLARGLRQSSQGLVRDSVNGLTAIGRADRDRTSIAPEAAAPVAGGGEGRGADMVFSEAEARSATASRRGGGGQSAAQRARAELASQAAARTMVAQIETDLTERRIAELDRLMGAETLAATAANDNGRAEVDRLLAAEEMEQGLADKRQRRLDADAAAHESYTGRLAELNDQRVHGAQRAAEFTNGAFESMGKAIGTHVQALIDGRESVGTALQGMLSDTLISVGKEAVIQGGMELAKGAAALAGVVTAPLAPGHFAAGAAFLSVGAAAGVAGAALAPSAPAAGASAPRGGAGGMLGDRPSDSGSGGATVIQITYNAPVIGGRESTDAELGERLGRYQRAAGSRS